MPLPRRTTVLSFLGFAAVLCLAIIFRPQNVAFPQAKTFPDLEEGEYSDVIGIELGRTYSRVGVFRNNIFEIIVDEQGRDMVPSYVAFTNLGSPLVGFTAMDQATSNPKNTIYDVRCLIGRRFSDPELQDNIKNLPYDVVERDGKPYIKVQIKGADKYLCPEEISSKVLGKLKSMAEAQLNRTVKYAVITIPSYFNDTQRQSTKDAAMIAGLEVLRSVNEPTAAGIAYGINVPSYDKASDKCEECNFVIYNLGAKESDLALESVDSGIFEILAQASDRNLGGEDLEAPLLKHIVARFNSENDVDVIKDMKAMKELRSEVEKAEQALSTESSAKIDIPVSEDFKRFSTTISRIQLQGLKRQLSNQALALVKQLLDDAKTPKRKVNGIIFTGDPAHIAKVQPTIEAYLDGRRALSPQNFSLNQAIVYGAAMQGRVLSTYDDEYVQYVEITPLSAGIETSGGIFTKLIQRNTILPTRKTLEVSTATDNQEKVVIKILEGERAIARKNKLIGTLELAGLPRKPRGVPEIEVAFEMEEDRSLKVAVREKESGKEAILIVPADEDRYGGEDIDATVMEAELRYEEDQLLLKGLLTEGQRGREGEFGVIVK